MPPYQRWVSKFEIKPGAWVFVPSEQAFDSGREIKKAIEGIWQPPKNYYHLRSGGHVAAIKSHCNNHCFIRLDIENFFGSINKSRVTRCLKPYFGYTEARGIADESTVRHPTEDKFILPFGFVQSPIIASVCLHEGYLGSTLQKLSKTPGIIVSVYVDDIIISVSDETLAPDIIQRVSEASKRSKLLLSPKKCEGPAGQITSFNINLAHNFTEIEQSRFEEFRRDYSSGNEYQKEGYKNYIKSVNASQSNLLV